MTTSPDYHRATNAAYHILQEMLIRHGHFRYATDVLFILEQMPNVSVLSYTDACEKYGCSREDLMCESSHGFTIRSERESGVKFIVLFNDWKDDVIIRFTLAHEIGHIVLNHKMDTEAANKEANCFARNLLCPVYIRNLLEVQTVESYCNVFNVSEPMAIASMGNSSYDFYHIEKDLYHSLCDIFELFLFVPESDALAMASGYVLR